MTRIAPDADWRVDAGDLIAQRALATRFSQTPRHRSRSILTGQHRSRLRGRGMDYRESRHYQAGDDIRNMDWRITARAGHAHVKVFDEERERPVMVVADFGPGMFFASRGAFKSVMAARLAALIGWAAISHGDRIGALLFDGEHRELQPSGGRRGQMRLIRALVAAGDPGPGLAASTHASELNRALARLRQVIRPGTLVWLLSDFTHADAETERHLSQLIRHNSLLAIEILDPLELAPPPPGRYRISDGQRNGLLDTLTGRRRGDYQRLLETHRAQARAHIEGCGIPYERCLTPDDPAVVLRRALSLSARRPPAHSSPSPNQRPGQRQSETAA
ncbi:DUF58 domain-containing protein [Thiorhodovibrio frisius]|uniref:DUF58 domain-containing protein n=1 Tax=Thiorhodovibrio frisius TaxID=631362 RepID=H8Z6I5_9GAMM|nr:DUF58 domain-containing protein [Thiorhodovibrio frisius]EIC19683.1 hypothetical protein Thi970DRAFT_03275 [Thiorhodovibrio frisius]WPL20349.1 hypothetical protein Thiofri_00436 [Thiorhodovibrio frisius]